MKTAANLAVRPIFEEAWDLFVKNWKVVLVLMLLPFFLEFVWNLLTEGSMLGGLLLMILGILKYVLSLIVSMGVIKGMIMVTKGKKVDIDTILSTKDQVVSYFVGTFLMGLMIVFGLILLIVPGVYALVKYFFVPILIVDKKLGGLEALSESSRMTKGIMMEVFMFVIASFIANLLGLLAFGVGALLTGSVTSLAYVLLYQRITAKAKA